MAETDSSKPSKEEKARLAAEKKAEKLAAKAKEKSDRLAAKEAAKAEKQRLRAEKKDGRRNGVKHAVNSVKIALAVVIFAAALAFAGISYWGYTITNNGVIMPGVSAEDISLAGMNAEEAAAALDAAGWDTQAQTPLEVTLPMNISMQISRLSSGAEVLTDTVIERACSFGHDGSWYENLYTYLRCYMYPHDVCDRQSIVLSDDYINAAIAVAQAQYAAATTGQEYGGYIINEERTAMTLMKAAGAVHIDETGLLAAVKDALLNKKISISYDKIISTADMPDFYAIYDELAKAPANAYYDEATKSIIPSEEGFTFDVDEARAMWIDAKPTEVINIPVHVLQPEINTEALEALLFKVLLGSKTTYYYSSSDARINNLALAASKINGFILNPGEVFSYNDTVGRRTAEAGFQEAAAYSDGEVVQEIGGGICQVSSTLYCAMLYANLRTVSRTPHYFPVDYMRLGEDATVSWPKPDFKFENNTEYPVRIVAYTDIENRELTVELWGVNEEGSYVELGQNVATWYDDTYTSVAIGYGVQEYRVIYDADGNYLRTVYEIYDVYHLHDYDIHWPEGVTPGAASDNTDSEEYYTDDGAAIITF